jgi:beta-phosphoglucomutase
VVEWKDATIGGPGGEVNELTTRRRSGDNAWLRAPERLSSDWSVNMSSHCRAVCFDFDGVLADTENVHVAAWQRTLARFGWEASDELCARAMEEDDRAFLAGIFARRKLEGADVEGWVRSKQGLTVELLAGSPRLYPGVAGLVRSLRGTTRLAVVTTTWRENVEVVLEASGLLDAFETIVAKEDVRTPKPDPECYLLAVERLGVPASAVAAIEDSASGMTAARAAGLRALAVGHRQGRGDWVGDSPFLDDLRNVERVMNVLGLRSAE